MTRVTEPPAPFGSGTFQGGPARGLGMASWHPRVRRRSVGCDGLTYPRHHAAGTSSALETRSLGRAGRSGSAAICRVPYRHCSADCCIRSKMPRSAPAERRVGSRSDAVFAVRCW